MCAIFVVAHGATAFLLYVRVCAVYSMKPSVMVFFGFTWLAIVAGASTAFWAVKGIHIGPTNYCTTMVVHEFVLAITWSDFVNDTLVFLAIIYKLSIANIPRSSNTPAGVWAILRGRSPMIQGFTKAFMQDSQIYYL